MEEESKGREGRRRRRKTSRLTERLNVISLLFHFGSLVHKLHSEFEIERETWSRSRNGDGAVAAAASVSLSPGPGLEQEKEEREVRAAGTGTDTRTPGKLGIACRNGMEWDRRRVPTLKKRTRQASAAHTQRGTRMSASAGRSPAFCLSIKRLWPLCAYLFNS